MIGWVVALVTVGAYPLAFYVAWRFYVERHDQIDTASTVCLLCAEKIKSAALACRHCGHEFEMEQTARMTETPLDDPCNAPSAALTAGRYEGRPCATYSTSADPCGRINRPPL